MPKKLNITGKMAYIPLSGGFWGILGENGERFRPVNELPDDYRLEGLPVRVSATEHHGLSIFMWGTQIKIHHIEPA